jgi:two-component system, sensor histidine kinase RpfC
MVAFSADSHEQSLDAIRTVQGGNVQIDIVPRMFEAFSQASSGLSRIAPGTGLGLAIAHGLARINHGSLVYEAAPDGCSCFVVRLPLATRARARVDGQEG